MNKYKNTIQELLIVITVIVLSVNLDYNQGIYNYIGEFGGTAIFAFLLWSLPFIIITTSTLKEITKQFQKVYFYYAYRLERRDKFILGLIYKMILIVMLLVAIRYIVYIIMYNISIDIALLFMSYLYMTAFSVASVLFIFAIYQIRKDDSIIAYSIIGYIVVSFISFANLVGYQWIAFIDINWLNVIVMIIISIVMCFVNIRIINKNYLYD